MMVIISVCDRIDIFPENMGNILNTLKSCGSGRKQDKLSINGANVQKDRQKAETGKNQRQERNSEYIKYTKENYKNYQILSANLNFSQRLKSLL